MDCRENIGKYPKHGLMISLVNHYPDGVRFISFNLTGIRKNVLRLVGMLWAMNVSVLVWVRIMDRKVLVVVGLLSPIHLQRGGMIVN